MRHQREEMQAAVAKQRIGLRGRRSDLAAVAAARRGDIGEERGGGRALRVEEGEHGGERVAAAQQLERRARIQRARREDLA